MAKILLVDDDEDILQSLEFFLKRNNFEVVALSSGNKVEQTVKDSNPDIILMDVNLNGYDGREICRQLRAHHQLTIPIILFSAVSEYHQSYSDYGADGFIDKPFEAKNLVACLRAYLN